MKIDDYARFEISSVMKMKMDSQLGWFKNRDEKVRTSAMREYCLYYSIYRAILEETYPTGRTISISTVKALKAKGYGAIIEDGYLTRVEKEDDAEMDRG